MTKRARRTTAALLLTLMLLACVMLILAWAGHEHNGLLCDSCLAIARAARHGRLLGLVCLAGMPITGRIRRRFRASWPQRVKYAAKTTPVRLGVRLNQ